MPFILALQIMSPVCAPAMGASSTYSQSQEMEAELQHLIESRLETGQGPLPLLRAQKSVVSSWSALNDLATQAYTRKLKLFNTMIMWMHGSLCRHVLHLWARRRSHDSSWEHRCNAHHDFERKQTVAMHGVTFV